MRDIINGVIPPPPSLNPTDPDTFEQKRLWEEDITQTYGSVDTVMWGFNTLQEYQYRKVFGLSKAEMLNEPLKDFIINSKIMTFVSELEERKIKEIDKKGGRN